MWVCKQVKNKKNILQMSYLRVPCGGVFCIKKTLLLFFFYFDILRPKDLSARQRGTVQKRKRHVVV